MSQFAPSKAVNILLVEDSDLDVKRIRRGLERLGYHHPILRAQDGVEALELLRSGKGIFETRLPLVILLDLNMPRMGGIEFLEELRRDPVLKPIPVFVITTSDMPRDVEAAFSHNVGGYFVKPPTSAEMNDVLQAIAGYWAAGVMPA